MLATHFSGRGLATFALASTLFGCGTSTRYITPWLRTTQHTQFELIAESGSHPDNWMRADRKIKGVWREVSVQSDFGFSLADDTRAVLDGQLMTEDGRTIPLDCDIGDAMRLRATPDGKHLVCVLRPKPPPRAPGSDPQSKGPDSPIEITSRDLNGVIEWQRRVPSPVSIPEDAPVLSADVYTSFLGFVPAGLVFSVEVVDYVHSAPISTPSICTAYVLQRDDSWRKLGSLSYVNERWKCNFPWPWTSALGFEVAMGKYGRSTDGEPNPN